jgi:hypothetical protein
VVDRRQPEALACAWHRSVANWSSAACTGRTSPICAGSGPEKRTRRTGGDTVVCRSTGTIAVVARAFSLNGC